MRPADSGAATSITGKSASGVGIASIVSAVAGIVILFVTSHFLTPEDNAEFLSFWAALFCVYGVLGGIQAETTRAVGSARVRPNVAGPTGARVLGAGFIVGGLTALTIFVLSPLLSTYLFPKNSVAIVAALALTAILYSGQAALAGSLQGSHRWSTYANFVGLEAVSRLTAIAIAALIAVSLLGIEMACLCALAAWLLALILSPNFRRAATARADVPLGKLLRNTGHALVSAASSAALIVAFPILVKLTTPGAEYAQSAPLLLAISLTRAPILVPLQAFQGVAITEILKDRSKGWNALKKPIGLLLLIGLGGAVIAGLVGPYLMLVFGPRYHVDGWLLALLTLAAVLIAVLTLLGTAVLALGHHRAYSAGWLIATVVSIVMLVLPLSVDVRVVLSLTLGPVVGITIQAAALGLLGSVRHSVNESD